MIGTEPCLDELATKRLMGARRVIHVPFQINVEELEYKIKFGVGMNDIKQSVSSASFHAVPVFLS